MFNINDFDTQTLAKIYCNLNHWEWPSELGENEIYNQVHEHLRNDNSTTKYDIGDPIMKEIENKIGTKECLKWHHLNNLKRTDEQFEQWWDNEKDNLWRVIKPKEM